MHGPWRERGVTAGRRRGPSVGPALAAAAFHLAGARMQATHGGPVPDPLGYALLLAGPVALLARRRAPVAVSAVTAAAATGFAVTAAPGLLYAAAPLIALWGAAAAGRLRPAALVGGAAVVAYLLAAGVFADELGIAAAARPDLGEALRLVLAAGLALFLGAAARSRAQHYAEMAQVRAERRRVEQEQARAQAEQQRRQASEERLRIARELHDVLGHHLSLINVQAGVGLHLLEKNPEQARASLTAIRTASAEALREVRAVLDALRPEREAAPRQPALGLDRLGELTADAGLPVTTTTAGVRRDLPAEVDRAAYRIVQEALTNVRRHAAAGASAAVAVEYAPHALRLSVRDDGAAAGPPGGADGSGIAGMRARAESLGGTLEAGPQPGGGFLVRAELPTGAGREDG